MLEKLESALKLQQQSPKRKINKRNKVEVCKVIIFNNLSPWNAQTKLHYLVKPLSSLSGNTAFRTRQV